MRHRSRAAYAPGDSRMGSLKKLFIVKLRGPIPCDAARMYAGFCRQSRASAASATITAAAPSVSRQLSNSRSGSEMMRELA